MVMLRHDRPYTSYEVYDENGNSVGCVILPKSRKVIGRDQPTVLLRRRTPQSDRIAPTHESAEAPMKAAK